MVSLAAARDRYNSDLDGFHVTMWIEYNIIGLSRYVIAGTCIADSSIVLTYRK